MKSALALLLGLSISHGAFSLTLLTTDFESATAGAGGLTTTTPDFFVGAFGNTVNNTFVPSTDPITGVVNSSPINTGKAGYIGGTSTNLTFDSGSGSLNILAFQTDPLLASRNIIGTNEAQRSVTVDFAVSRGGGSTNQAFSFYLFDGLDESNINTFQYHSFVTILSNNTVTYRNNNLEGLTSTSLTLTPNNTYRLEMFADYDLATWSATITDLSSSTSTDLVTDNSINTSGFTLSGWTTPETLDIDTFVTGDFASGAPLQDTLYFDNYNAEAIPEPSQICLMMGLGALLLSVTRRKP